MRVKSVIKMLSYVILGMWILSVFVMIVFPNVHAMAKYMGNELAYTALYVFTFGWIVAFAMLTIEGEMKRA